MLLLIPCENGIASAPVLANFGGILSKTAVLFGLIAGRSFLSSSGVAKDKEGIDAWLSLC